jgi:hypothetical protein
MEAKTIWFLSPRLLDTTTDATELRRAVTGRHLVGNSLADGDSGTGGGDHNGNGDSQLLHERTPETHQNKICRSLEFLRGITVLPYGFKRD